MPSSFEAIETREQRCGQCRLPGHSRNSPHCPVNLCQLLKATSSPIASTPPLVPDLYIINRSNQIEALVPGSPVNEVEDEDDLEIKDSRPIWPSRSEVIYSKYLAKKEAWLAAHPTIQSSNYHKAIGLKDWDTRWCKEQAKFLPSQRLDIKAGKLLDGRPHWTTEEIEAWLDFEALKDTEADRLAEEELAEIGGFGEQRGVRSIWARIDAEKAAERVSYRFAP
jgi:hypothetical protein